MKVEATSPEYKIQIARWIKCRDVIEGSDAVKEKETEYLPKLTGQKTEAYAAYITRALFYGASGRTVAGLSGAVFRKQPEIEVPDTMEEAIAVFTNKGYSFSQAVNTIVEEILKVGRVGLLVDPAKGESNRAFAAIYTAENIDNWRTEIVDGKEKTVMVKLKEQSYEPVDGDPFEVEAKPRYRVLSINSEGNYQQEVYLKIKDKEEFQIDASQTVVPERLGKKLTEIPFQFINVNNLTSETSKPPLLDLIEVNLSHYRTSADLEHGAHYTALPTPWLAGFPTDKELVIGSGVAWISTDVKAKAGFLEYTGQGLGALTELKKEKESMMAKLGAKMLEEQNAGVESAETHKLRQSSEGGALLNIVSSISEGMQNVLKLMGWWSGVTDTSSFKFKLNKDFVSLRLTPQEMTSLMQTWQGGGISQSTFLTNLKLGEVLPEDISVDDEIDRIENDASNMRNEDGVPFGNE